MTKLLEQVFVKASELSEQEQNSLAARWLEELGNEALWAKKFAETSDEQWDKLAALAEADIAEGDTVDLEKFLDLTKV